MDNNQGKIYRQANGETREIGYVNEKGFIVLYDKADEYDMIKYQMNIFERIWWRLRRWSGKD